MSRVNEVYIKWTGFWEGSEIWAESRNDENESSTRSPSFVTRKRIRSLAEPKLLPRIGSLYAKLT